MAEAFAGFVCGFALAIVATPIAAIALVRARVSSPTLRQVVPEGTSLAAVSMVLHGFAFLGLTAIGLVLGMILLGIEGRSPAGGLGSPNRVFTAFILALAAIAVGPLAVAAPRLRAPLLAGGLVFVVTFGWIMPWLSLLGPNGE
ncbi:MAG: hypothetical protein WEE64_04430 [Dehalococcoidia bacterium]